MNIFRKKEWFRDWLYKETHAKDSCLSLCYYKVFPRPRTFVSACRNTQHKDLNIRLELDSDWRSQVFEDNAQITSLTAQNKACQIIGRLFVFPAFTVVKHQIKNAKNVKLYCLDFCFFSPLWGLHKQSFRKKDQIKILCFK